MMPSPKIQKKAALEKIRKGKLSERACSFNIGESRVVVPAEMLIRPKTVPDFRSEIRSAEIIRDKTVYIPPKLTKLLVNVTIHRSVGAVKVIVPLEVTVEELAAAVLRQYVKEMRLPALHSLDASAFDLHYSQFSLESLNREEQVMNLGSRNFFLCPNTAAVADSSSICSKVADKTAGKGIPWLKFMGSSL